MFELLFTRPKFLYYMSLDSLALHDKLVNDKTFKSHRTSRMNSASANAYLCSKSVSESICETRTSIDERSCGVDTSTKDRRSGVGLGDDRVCMMRRMGIDEVDSRLQRFYSFHRYSQCQVFRCIRRFIGWLYMRIHPRQLKGVQ